MTDRDAKVLLIIGGTMIALFLATVIWVWVNSYTIPFTPIQLPTL